MSSIVRTASFFTTWVAEFLRHPLLLFGLVLGPFLILIAFGQGVDYSEIKPDVILVRSEHAAEEQDELVPDTLHEHVNVVAETTDLPAAIESLRNGYVDGVAVVPTNFGDPINEGRRIPIQIFTSDIDPVTVQFTESYLLDRVARLNQETLARAIEEAQLSVGDVQTHIDAARRLGRCRHPAAAGRWPAGGARAHLRGSQCGGGGKHQHLVPAPGYRQAAPGYPRVP
jgi:ABC-2 type transport system permease protein